MQHFYRKIIAREKERSNSFAKIRRRKIERKYCLLKKNCAISCFRISENAASFLGWRWFACNSSSKNAAKNLWVTFDQTFFENFSNSKKVVSSANGNAIWSAFERLAQLRPDVARRDVSGKCLRWRGGAGGIRRGGGGGREVTPVHSRLLSPVVLVGVFVTGAFLLLLVLLFDDALEQPLEGVYFLVFLI